jgi:hypothetical protein
VLRNAGYSNLLAKYPSASKKISVPMNAKLKVKDYLLSKFRYCTAIAHDELARSQSIRSAHRLVEVQLIHPAQWRMLDNRHLGVYVRGVLGPFTSEDLTGMHVLSHRGYSR